MHFMFYQKPDYIPKCDGPLELPNCQKYVERACKMKAEIPPSLSFDNVIEGKTVPPCSLQDFMDYLVYVAHDAENLQFYLWLTDYTKRFEALPQMAKDLSPEWRVDEKAMPSLPRKALVKPLPTPTFKESFYFSDDEPTTPLTPQYPLGGHQFSSEENLLRSSSNQTLQPVCENGSRQSLYYDVQPFREEINQILAHYVNPSAPRELNLSHRTRCNLLQALQHTTHPSAFAPLFTVVSLTLRNQSHPNFIRWSICNGNKPRVLFLRGLAITVITMALIISALLILSHKSRWWRTFALPFFWFGTVNLVAAHRGLCVLLYRFHEREIHPWEVDKLRDSPASSFDLESRSSTSMDKLVPLGPSNTYQNEPWVQKWANTSWLRKINLKKLRAKNDALRLVQNKIIQQAHVWAVIISISLTAGMVAIPEARLI